MEKTYLGDGVYLDHDGYQIILTSEDGEKVLDKIYLEREVALALVKKIEECYK